MNDLTQILERAESGDRTARERLVIVVYHDLVPTTTVFDDPLHVVP